MGSGMRSLPGRCLSLACFLPTGWNCVDLRYAGKRQRTRQAECSAGWCEIFTVGSLKCHGSLAIRIRAFTRERSIGPLVGHRSPQRTLIRIGVDRSVAIGNRRLCRARKCAGNGPSHNNRYDALDDRTMDIEEYKTRALKLFRSGEATPGQWDELAVLVLQASESSEALTEQIDAAILGPSVLCARCESIFYPGEGPCMCGAPAPNPPAADGDS